MGRDLAELDLWLLDRISAYDLRYSPDQPRDEHGRFGSGEGGGESGDGGGKSGGKSGTDKSAGGTVRDSLVKAKNTAEVQQVLADGLHQAMGRPVEVNLQGMNAQVAREHAEGILRVAEKFPNNDLAHVVSYSSKGKGAMTNDEVGRYSEEVLARTVPGRDESGHSYYSIRNDDTIAFNIDKGPAAYRSALERSSGVAKDPTGAAIHEMGHVLSIHNDSIDKAYDAAKASSGGAKDKEFFDHVTSQISKYASGSQAEMAAEGFADVMINGSGASALSHAIYDAIAEGQK